LVLLQDRFGISSTVITTYRWEYGKG